MLTDTLRLLLLLNHVISLLILSMFMVLAGSNLYPFSSPLCFRLINRQLSSKYPHPDAKASTLTTLTLNLSLYTCTRTQFYMSTLPFLLDLVKLPRWSWKWGFSNSSHSNCSTILPSNYLPSISVATAAVMSVLPFTWIIWRTFSVGSWLQSYLPDGKWEWSSRVKTKRYTLL